MPYRDSKLTRLLQGALSGNSLVSILCTIQTTAGSGSTANTHATETLNTLKFASRAKNSIVSHAKRAEEALGAGGEGGARVLLERYRMEIQELRSQLDSQAKSNNTKAEEEEKQRDEEEERAREKEASARHEEQMLEMQLARTALKERIEHLNRLILSSKSTGVNSNGTYSALGIHPRFSQTSIRTSVTTNASRPLLERTASVGSSASTIGRRSSAQRLSGTAEGGSGGEEDSVGEYGDGIASLQSQNQALQADLADKNRYIATLEKRLVQARRASSSRTSMGNKGIMVGEDHSVSAVMREKDAEIAELRARLEDKDRMLTALRNAARSRDAAEGIEQTMNEARNETKHEVKHEVKNEVGHEARSEVRSSLLYEGAASPPPLGALPDPPTAAANKGAVSIQRRTRSVDEMSRILDEMIQDRVETGQIVMGSRGSVRVANDQKAEAALRSSRTSPDSVLNKTPVDNGSREMVFLGV